MSPLAHVHDFALDAPLHASFRAYNSLLLLGFFGLLAVLGTALLAPGVQRNSAWITFYVSAILYAVSYLLLFFAGEGSTMEPEPALCLTQAVMTYAVCPFGTCAAMVLSMTMWAGVCRPNAYTLTKRIAQWGLIAPWVVMFTMLALALGIGLSNPEGVHLNHEFYCQIDNRIPAHTAFALVMLTFTANLIFQALTFHGLWNLRVQEDQGEQAPAPVLSVAIRMLLWNASTISLVIIIYVLLVHDGSSEHVVSLVQAALPLLAVAAFGTRMDILRAWAAVFTGDRRQKWQSL